MTSALFSFFFCYGLLGNDENELRSGGGIGFYCKITILVCIFGLIWSRLDLAVILNMSMHGSVQSYLLKQIIIPKRSPAGSEGVARFQFSPTF